MSIDLALGWRRRVWIALLPIAVHALWIAWVHFRFSPDSAATVGSLTARTPTVLAIPTDRSTRPWRLRTTGAVSLGGLAGR